MKKIAFIIVLIAIIGACSTPKNNLAPLPATAAVKGDTVRIANDSLEYEVIIIDPGFSTWLNSIALPGGYYSQFYLENKNRFYITEWNNRAQQPLRFDPNLYEMTINYDPQINYGYEVNYLIYNYMIYFQNRYQQRLFGNVPIR
jgi:signal peptidase I